jgi:hypothetical protein
MRSEGYVWGARFLVSADIPTLFLIVMSPIVRGVIRDLNDMVENLVIEVKQMCVLCRKDAMILTWVL